MDNYTRSFKFKDMYKCTAFYYYKKSKKMSWLLNLVNTSVRFKSKVVGLILISHTCIIL